MNLPNLKRFFKNQLINKSIKVLLLRMLGVILFFSITLFITNYFDPELVGAYDYSRSLLTILSAISVLGMNQSILYYSGVLSSKKALPEIKLIYHKMIRITLIFSLIITFLALIFNWLFAALFLEKVLSNILLKSLVILVFYSLFIINIDTLRALKKVYLSELLRNILRYAPLFIIVLVLHYTNKENWLLEGFLISVGFLGVGSTLFLLHYFKKYKLTRYKHEFTYKSIINRSGPMAISAVAFMLMQSVDIILLGRFVGLSEVAYYASAVKITMIIALVLTTVNAIYAPIISELFSLNYMEELKQKLKDATRLISLLTLPAIIFIAAFSNLILSFFGEYYVTAQQALLILLVSQTVNMLCGSVGVYMNMTGKQKVLQSILIISFLLNLLFNWILIPIYGMTGAASATAISMIFWNVSGAIYLLKTDKVKTFLN